MQQAARQPRKQAAGRGQQDAGGWKQRFPGALPYKTILMKNILRVLRAERRWSQADLAARLGVSRQTVNAIETGKSDPSLPLAFKIAQVFGKTIEQIFSSDELKNLRKRRATLGTRRCNRPMSQRIH